MRAINRFKSFFSPSLCLSRLDYIFDYFLCFVVRFCCTQNAVEKVVLECYIDIGGGGGGGGGGGAVVLFPIGSGGGGGGGIDILGIKQPMKKTRGRKE